MCFKITKYIKLFKYIPNKRNTFPTFYSEIKQKKREKKNPTKMRLSIQQQLIGPWLIVLTVFIIESATDEVI